MQDTSRLCMNCMKDMGTEYDTCPYCGFTNDTKQKEGYLPFRLILKDRFLVGMLQDSNSEGNTYLGWDVIDERPVFIREFMPGELCQRGIDGIAVVAKEGQDQLFDTTKHSFTELAKGVASIERAPSLLPTIDIFEAYGTVFYVTEYVVNITLESFLTKNGNRFNWEQTRALMMPILVTLRQAHKAGILHRGISPKTIIVGRDGKLRLTGFCISEVRVAKGNLKPELFQGYAATEQYSTEANTTFATDIYGFAATMYRMLTGITPPSSKDRMTNDTLVIPNDLARTLPRNVLVALANGLQILPQNRTPNVYDMHAELVKGDPTPAPQAPAQPVEEEPEKKGGSAKPVIITVIIALLIIGIAAAAYFLYFKDKINTQPESSQAVSSQAVSSTVSGQVDYVPNLVGKTYPEASKLLSGKFTLTVTSKQYSTTVAKGKIISQSPEPNKSVENNGLGQKTNIDIVISLGPSTGVMPDVSNKTYYEAFALLVEAGFSPDNILKGEKYDANIDPECVVDTNPIANTTNVSFDSEVTIYVNTREEKSSQAVSSKATSSEQASSRETSSSTSSKEDSSTPESSETSSETSSTTSEE